VRPTKGGGLGAVLSMGRVAEVRLRRNPVNSAPGCTGARGSDAPMPTGQAKRFLGLTAMATSATPEDERRCSPWPFPSPRPFPGGRGRLRSALRATFMVRLGRSTPFSVLPPQAALAAEPQEPAADAGADRRPVPLRRACAGPPARLYCRLASNALSRACLLPRSMTSSALWLSLPRIGSTPRRASRRRRVTLGYCCQ